MSAIRPKFPSKRRITFAQEKTGSATPASKKTIARALWSARSPRFANPRTAFYRRDEEVHRLKVFSRAEVTAWLRKIGFRVRTHRGYGDYQLGPRQSVFVCRKR
jgi:hypothetical protein